MKKTIIVLLAIVMISSLMAQPRANQLPRSHRPMGVVGMKHNMAHPGPQGFGQPSERMEMMITWKLTEELELVPEQADKFFPRMKAHRDNIEKFNSEIMEAVKDIRRKVEDGKDISDSEFNKMLGKITALEKQKVDEKMRFMTELNGILDNTQRLKLAMFKSKFTKEMQEQIRMRRKMMAK